MKKMKKWLISLLAVVCVGTAAVGLAGCNFALGQTGTSTESSKNSSSKKDKSSSKKDDKSSEDSSSSFEDSSSSEDNEGLEFTLNEDHASYSVIGIGTCTDTDIVIPAIYNGFPVTTIGAQAFLWCSSLTSVVIPDSVTTIGEWAFYDCSSLTSIVIGDSVTTIGVRAFYECSSLTSVVIGDSVTTIGYGAFASCYSLTSVVIGESVTTIGELAFANCSSLTSIEVGENNSTYKDIDGNLYSKDGTVLIQYAIGKTATEFVIPDSVTTIGDDAFGRCEALTSVEIGDSVATIGAEAFYNCTALTEIVYNATECADLSRWNRVFYNAGQNGTKELIAMKNKLHTTNNNTHTHH